MSSPDTRIVPDRTGRKPITVLSSVLLPMPFLPSRTKISPGRMSSATSRTTTASP